MAVLFPFTVSRMFSINAFTFFFDGLINSFPSYFLKFHPRKSNPSSMCVILVFSSESVSPRSFRKFSTKGLTSFSSNSFVLLVMIKSSAYRTKLTWFLFPFFVSFCQNLFRSAASRAVQCHICQRGRYNSSLWCPRFRWEEFVFDRHSLLLATSGALSLSVGTFASSQFVADVVKATFDVAFEYPLRTF